MIALYIGAPLLVILLVYLYIIAPGRGKNPFPNGMHFAHRGLHGGNRDGSILIPGGAPENSLLGFARAREAGLAVELDVHLLADDTLVVFHDDRLNRMTEYKGEQLLDTMTYAEVSQYHLSGTEEKVPTLDEMLATIDGKVPMLLEIKRSMSGRTEELCRAVDERMKRYCAETGGVFIMESFDPAVLIWFRRHSPQVYRGQLSGGAMFGKDFKNRVKSFAFNHMFGNVAARPQFIAYNLNNRKNFSLRVIRLLGAPTYFWTVRSEEARAQAIAEKPDGYIFELVEPPKP